MYSSITVTWTSIFGNWHMVPCPAIQVPFLCRITRFPCICISSYNQLTRSTKNWENGWIGLCNLHSVVFQYLRNSQRGGKMGEASSVIWVAAWEKNRMTIPIWRSHNRNMILLWCGFCHAACTWCHLMSQRSLKPPFILYLGVCLHAMGAQSYLNT
jgi:hypothetical protein